MRRRHMHGYHSTVGGAARLNLGFSPARTQPLWIANWHNCHSCRHSSSLQQAGGGYQRGCTALGPSLTPTPLVLLPIGAAIDAVMSLTALEIKRLEQMARNRRALEELGVLSSAAALDALNARKTVARKPRTYQRVVIADEDKRRTGRCALAAARRRRPCKAGCKDLRWTPSPLHPPSPREPTPLPNPPNDLPNECMHAGTRGA